MFSVCVLLYGDHFDLAYRVLTSLRESRPERSVADLRIGVNAVGAQTREFVWDFCGKQTQLPCYVYEPPRNVGKYPLMRRMFYDAKRPLAEHVMWFDDDSYLDFNPETWSWWLTVQQLAEQHTMVGDIWFMDQRGRQCQGIAQQPWYNGRPVPPTHKFKFCTGGWWTARSEFLRRWNYPFPEIFHNGGDSILGELMRQQRGTFKQFADGVVINEGREKSRRGLGVPLRTEVYPWQNYVPGQTACLAHHDFECRVHVFAETSA